MRKVTILLCKKVEASDNLEETINIVPGGGGPLEAQSVKYLHGVVVRLLNEDSILSVCHVGVCYQTLQALSFLRVRLDLIQCLQELVLFYHSHRCAY